MGGSQRTPEDLDSLYREVILDHHRRPRGRQPLVEPAVEVRRENRTCGDEVSIQLRHKGGSLDGVAVLGRGCALSVASGSLMAEAVNGATVPEALGLVARLRRLLQDPEDSGSELGPVAALAGVRRFPVRIRCVLLPWEALEEALERLGVTTEAPEEGRR